MFSSGPSCSTGSTVLTTAFMMTPHCCLVVDDEALIPRRNATLGAWSKFDLNNTIKIKFIWDGEWSIEDTIRDIAVMLCSRCTRAAQKSDDPGKINGAAARRHEALIDRGRLGAERRHRTGRARGI